MLYHDCLTIQQVLQSLNKLKILVSSKAFLFKRWQGRCVVADIPVSRYRTSSRVGSARVSHKLAFTGPPTPAGRGGGATGAAPAHGPHGPWCSKKQPTEDYNLHFFTPLWTLVLLSQCYSSNIFTLFTLHVGLGHFSIHLFIVGHLFWNRNNHRIYIIGRLQQCLQRNLVYF